MSPCVHMSAHWWQWHPPVGVFIAILGLLGVLVPLFRPWDKIGPRERAVWTFLMFLFLILELRTLYLDRDEHDREQALARCEQLQSFGQIASTLGTAITTSQTQFAQTMKGVDKVFNKTQIAAESAREAVKNITGGDTWGWVSTIHFPSMPQGVYGLVFSNEGNYTMRSVRLTVAEISETFVGARATQCTVGDIPAHYRGLFTPCLIEPNQGKTSKYFVVISADNGAIIENFTLNPKGGAFSGSVSKTMTNGKRKILKRF
jgi:hypothetical protein